MLRFTAMDGEGCFGPSGRNSLRHNARILSKAEECTISNLAPGNAILLNGVVPTANREIDVPGFQPLRFVLIFRRSWPHRQLMRPFVRAGAAPSTRSSEIFR